MKHLDANVLIAWHRADHEHHERVATWCSDLISRHEPFGAHDLAWTAFLRICTSRRVFKIPSGLDDAFAFRRSVVGQHHYFDPQPTPDRWDRIESQCRTHRATANLVNDAVLAAAATGAGADLVSLDHDFARFRGLSWIDPSTQ